MMRERAIIVLCLLFAVMPTVGCAAQHLIERSHAEPPNWLLTPPDPADGKEFFVGRSIPDRGWQS